MKEPMNRTTAHADYEGGIPQLIRQLSSPTGMTRLHAREALIAAGDPAVDSLIEALDSDRAVVRWEAAKALASLPSRRAAPPLVAALEDRESDVRWLAAEALIAVGPASLNALFEALEMRADSVWLREGAHHVLKSTSNGAAKAIVAPVLAALEHHDAELLVPYAARDAIAKLSRQEDKTNIRKENLR